MLLPVMVVLALGVAVALVVLVIRAPVPDDDPIQAQPTAISLMREGPEPADPSAPLSYLLTWGGGEDEEWYVVRYSEDDPGSPAAVEAEGYDGMSLTVVVEDAVGTCFFVASEADRERLTAAGLDPSRAELRSDDGCVGTTATVVGGA